MEFNLSDYIKRDFHYFSNLNLTDVFLNIPLKFFKKIHFYFLIYIILTIVSFIPGLNFIMLFAGRGYLITFSGLFIVATSFSNDIISFKNYFGNIELFGYYFLYNVLKAFLIVINFVILILIPVIIAVVTYNIYGFEAKAIVFSFLAFVFSMLIFAVFLFFINLLVKFSFYELICFKKDFSQSIIFSYNLIKDNMYKLSLYFSLLFFVTFLFNIISGSFFIGIFIYLALKMIPSPDQINPEELMNFITKAVDAAINYPETFFSGIIVLLLISGMFLFIKEVYISAINAGIFIKLRAVRSE